MPFNFISLFMSIIVPMVVGASLIRLIFTRYKFPIVFVAALSYLLGSGLMTLWMLLLGMFNIPFNHLLLIALPPLFLSLFMEVINYCRSKTSIFTSHLLLVREQHREKIPHPILTAILLLYITVTLAYIFIMSVTTPISAWDAIATFSFKAKVFFYDGSLHNLNFIHSAYPLLVSFSETWTALNLSYWDESLVKIFFPLVLMSYMICQFYFVRAETNVAWALGSLCLILSSGFLIHHTTTGYVDVVIGCYSSCTLILLLCWRRYRFDGLLILAGLFSGLTSFIKFEGSPYLVIHSVLILLILRFIPSTALKDKTKSFLKFAFPSYLICLSYHVYKIWIGAHNPTDRIQLDNNIQLLDRLINIIRVLFNEMWATHNWNVLWGILLITIFLHFKKITPDHSSFFILSNLILYFIFYIGVSLFTPSFIYLGGPLTHLLISRMFLHFLPLVTILITILSYQPTKTS